jgi:peptide/nickel transport system permease protein
LLAALRLIRLFSVGLGWLPTSGYGDWRHLVLPTLALSLFSAAALFRLTRANMTEALGSDFVALARLKGMPVRVVVLRHALRNASLPIITFAGSQFGILLGGGVAIETIFAWPGIGLLVVNSILGLDYIVVQASAVIIVVVFVLLNFAVDLLYGWIDPRIRYA